MEQGKRIRQSRLSGVLMLLLAALIWGTAFVAQSVGMDYVDPFTFNAARSFIGTLILLPVVSARWYRKRQGGAAVPPQRKREERKTLWFSGILCGVVLCTASLLQQVGIQYTSVGKAGFLTALYVVLVPVLGLFFGKRPAALVWLAVVIALAGTYLLSAAENLSVSPGDLLVIVSALFFSVHIMLVDRFAPEVDGIQLSCIQFLVSAVLSMALALIFEKPQVSAILSAWLPLLYTGILSSGVAYTLQILGQKRVSPTAACIIMSMESVFAAAAGWLLLGDILSGREICGSAMVFCAVILAQLPRKQQNQAEQPGKA